MSKEMFIVAHEQLIEEYLEEHPDATWSEAYQVCGEKAYEKMRDMYADAADALKNAAKS